MLSLAGEQCAPGATAELPALPDPDRGGGLTLEVWFETDTYEARQTLLDARGADGRGVLLEVPGSQGMRSVRLSLTGARRRCAWDSDPWQLAGRRRQHVVAIVDGGPKIISFVVNGCLGDGGLARQYGWGRFDPDMGLPAGTAGTAGRGSGRWPADAGGWPARAPPLRPRLRPRLAHVRGGGQLACGGTAAVTATPVPGPAGRAPAGGAPAGGQSAEQVVFAGPRRVAIREVGVGAPGAGQVRVRTLCSGISHGTEMNVYRGTAPQYRTVFDRTLRLFVESDAPTWTYPRPYGYSAVGQVEEVGAGVVGTSVGDVVWCPAGHQTHSLVAADAAQRVPDGVPPECAVLVANLRTTLGGLLNSGVRLGETAAVFGQGVLGLLMDQWLKLSGAGQIIGIDPLPQRRDLALRIGADTALDPTAGDVAVAVRRLTDGRGADVTFDLSASYAGLNQAIRTAAPIRWSWRCRGTPATRRRSRSAASSTTTEVTLKCSQTAGLDPAIAHRWSIARRNETVLRYLPRFALRPLISHRIPFRRAAEAYALIDGSPGEVTQVVLTYD